MKRKFLFILILVLVFLPFPVICGNPNFTCTPPPENGLVIRPLIYEPLGAFLIEKIFIGVDIPITYFESQSIENYK